MEELLTIIERTGKVYLKLSNAEGEVQNVVVVQTCRKNRGSWVAEIIKSLTRRQTKSIMRERRSRKKKLNTDLGSYRITF